MNRKPDRWRTPLGRWVASYTIPRLTRELAQRGSPVTPKAVYSWVAGRTRPRLPVALTVVRLSEGSVSLDDICPDTSGAMTR